MSAKVFISGSISIKKLPTEVIKSIDKIISQNFEILVGDAKGVDSLVQNYCSKMNYFNVTVYTIGEAPRYLLNQKFKVKKIKIADNIKKEFQRQQEKDIAMTKDCDYCLIVWDEKSKGSYSNILRAIEYKKKFKVYLTKTKKFLESTKINKLEIEHIYRENSGFTASEIIERLKKDVSEDFKSTKFLYKFLLDKKMIIKEGKIYLPEKNYSNLFIVNRYKGKITGIKFRNEFLNWIEKELKSISQRNTQMTLFPNNPPESGT